VLELQFPLQPSPFSLPLSLSILLHTLAHCRCEAKMIYVHITWAMSEAVCMFAIHDVCVRVCGVCACACMHACVRACVRACGCSRTDDEFAGAAHGY
jgi:hypothetical protein